MHISQIWIYPIKSCAGISLNTADLLERGLAFDRHWMLIDETSTALTMRKMPKLARIVPQLIENSLIVNAPGMPQLELPIVPEQHPKAARWVRLWEGPVAALAVEAATDWFSRYLQATVELVYG